MDHVPFIEKRFSAASPPVAEAAPAPNPDLEPESAADAPQGNRSQEKSGGAARKSELVKAFDSERNASEPGDATTNSVTSHSEQVIGDTFAERNADNFDADPASWRDSIDPQPMPMPTPRGAEPWARPAPRATAEACTQSSKAAAEPAARSTLKNVFKSWVKPARSEAGEASHEATMNDTEEPECNHEYERGRNKFSQLLNSSLFGRGGSGGDDEEGDPEDTSTRAAHLALISSPVVPSLRLTPKGNILSRNTLQGKLLKTGRIRSCPNGGACDGTGTTRCGLCDGF